ncbi:sugar nucleotide-binding protein [Candidatus Pacearchaeota archaeon]|nr:sugar nucleotide-binding protein [Candidatus Pacearchaeota archaeon]
MSLDRPLILGKGYVSSFFKAKLPQAIHHQEKIRSLQDAQELCSSFQPTHIINCAGITGKPNVDWCESHASETYFGNVILPLFLASVTTKQGIHLTHVGSGCIYEGNNNGQGFSEEDAPNFSGSLYSRSKAVAERVLQDFPVLQVRLRMPLDSVPHPRNLLTKLLNYAEQGNPIVSALNSISYLPDFTHATLALMDRGKTGIYNIVNPGAITHEELLNAYFSQFGLPPSPIRFISPGDLDKLTAARRSNCVLSDDKLAQEIGSRLPNLKENLVQIITEYGAHQRKVQ